MPTAPVVAIVWGETRGLTPLTGSPAELARLQAVVAGAVMAAQPRGQAGRYRTDLPPRVGTPDAQAYEALSATVGQVTSGGWTGAALPPRAVLWEITNAGTPVVDDDGALPPAVAWIAGPGVNQGGDFTNSGRTWRLYESDRVLEGADLPFISSWSGSGVAPPRRSKPRVLWAWGMGVAGVAIFIAAGILAVAAGRSMATTWQLLATDQPAHQRSLVASVAATCYADSLAFPTRETFKPPPSPPDVCIKPEPTPVGAPPTAGRRNPPPPYGGWRVRADVLQRAGGCATANTSSADCSLIWRAALSVTATQSFGDSMAARAQRLSVWLNGTSPLAGVISMVVQLSLLMGGIALLVVSLGIGVHGIWFGAWIDQRNRVSLARAQVTLWTIVALGGYAAMALFNIGAGRSGGDLGAFPNIPAAIAAALGIAVTSPMLSALILNRKAAGQTHYLANEGTPGDRGAMFHIGAANGLEARSTPQDATLADLFMGEEVATANTIDPSRLQNVVITVMLVLGYVALLLEAVRDLGVSVFWKATPWFTQLPDPGMTFAALLAASHATYLLAKQFNNTPSAPVGAGDPTPPGHQQ